MCGWRRPTTGSRNISINMFMRSGRLSTDPPCTIVHHESGCPAQGRGMTNEGSVADQSFRDEELLAAVVADLIGDVRHVAVGNASPIPAAAALLARARGDELNLGRPYVSLLGSPRHTFWTDGGRELFDCAGQGRIDVFFLSGGEIDGQGNVNLVSIGDPDKPTARFPG